MSEFWAMATPLIAIWISSIALLNIGMLVHIFWTTEKKVPWHDYIND
jgi:hypothetical protein